MQFKSFIQGGFECSTHLNDNMRLDLIEATKHNKFCGKDYKYLQQFGIYTVREGLRWHLIEKVRGRYDFSSLQAQVDAANEFNMEVIWDLCHYGFPDFLTIENDSFVDDFANFALASIKYLSEYYHGSLLICPINEPSFLTRSLVDSGRFDSNILTSNPNVYGYEIKYKLVEATAKAIDKIKSFDSNVVIFHVDPLIHIAYKNEEEKHRVRFAREAQYQSLDLLLNYDFNYVDVIGVNHYPYSNWWHEGNYLDINHPHCHKLSKLLIQTNERYHKPIFISETGVEGHLRPDWLQYVYDEIDNLDFPVHGICIYPITDYPGWIDNRYCPCGLLSYPDNNGNRMIYQPLASKILELNECIENSRYYEKVS